MRCKCYYFDWNLTTYPIFKTDYQVIRQTEYFSFPLDPNVDDENKTLDVNELLINSLRKLKLIIILK